MSRFELRSEKVVGYSPQERALFALLREEPRDSETISKLYYNGSMPYHGRRIVSTTLRELVHKVERNRESFRIIRSKRSGPIPMSFWLEAKR